MRQKKECEHVKDEKQKHGLSRREFLQYAGLAAGGVALFASSSESSGWR
jgi:hypothetical protein